MTRRSQAAMEFLMTYGWAILVVLAAIAALAYFGVLSPARFSPEKCVMEVGVSCSSFRLEPNSIALALQNGKGSDMYITEVTVKSGDANCSKTYANESFPNGEMKVLSIDGSNCNVGEPGTKYKGDITISYIDGNSGFQKKMAGTVSGKVQ